MKITSLATLLSCALCTPLMAQVTSVDKLEAQYLNWHNRDLDGLQILSTSVDKTYRELLAGRPENKTAVVAVIDSEGDIDHEDLKGKIWINEDEIPGNKVDDDGNGYIDDIHGWNFIGNKNGVNIHYENMEYTRIYKAGGGGELFEGAKAVYMEQLERRVRDKENILKFEEVYNKAKLIIKGKTGIVVRSVEDLDGISPDDEAQVLKARDFLYSKFEQGFSEKGLAQLKEVNNDYLEKFLNLQFSPRTAIIGDDPEDINDNDYGNADVKGPRADHGTAVAGIIAAIRDNNVGINGIATDVRIMCIRSTPRGDERDKDVALAIKYAVDNGADIINMSFGKQFSPEKRFVDDAVRLAEQKNVLLVHGSGNDGRNIDIEASYPSDAYLDDTEASNWINVGATGSSVGDECVAIFSNYGEEHVDLFAPGQQIISLDTGNHYSMNDGTSLSAPVVSGIAALLLAYHPSLSAKDLVQLLTGTAYTMDKLKVLIPDLESPVRRKVRFKTLSKSGGVVNAYEAMKKADLLTGVQE